MQLKPILVGFTGRKALFDVEVYPNYILLTFHDVDTEVTMRFRIDPDNGINDRKAAEAYYRSLSVAIGYNSHGYDDHILDVVFKGVDCFDVWEHGDQIIRSGGRRRSPFIDKRGDPKPGFPLSLDLAALLTAKIGESKDGKPRFGFPGLKSLGNRFGHKHLQTLPIKPGTTLSGEQKRAIDSYNVHDIAITGLVLKHLDAAIEMRRALGLQYGVNLISRADAKLAEMMVKTAYTAAMNQKILATWNDDDEPEPFVLNPPRKTDWVCGGSDILSNRHSFTDLNLSALLNKVMGWTMHWKRWVDANGSVQMDKPSFNAKVRLRDKTYSFGLGGLHSEDDPLVIEADVTHAITDIDVSSYYPGLVVEERIAPGHLDADIFCGVFAGLMATRLEAKAKKQKEIAQGMKIAINSGGYGKLSDRYSPFRDPPKGAAITINGQLILLRLIEGLLGIEGVRILSANTDGVLIHHPREAMEQICRVMEQVRDIYRLNKFDVTEVIRLCRASVNEYVMSYRDPDTGEVAIKGRGAAFNDGTKAENLNKKTDKRITKQALIDYLLFDKPIAETVRQCRDLIMFVGYETLHDAWDHIEDADGNHLTQTTNRWYESTGGTTLHKVAADGRRQRYPKMQQVVVVNDLPDEFPADVSYDYYIEEAQRAANDILHPNKKAASRRKKADQLSDDEREEWEDRQNQADVDVGWLTSLDLTHYRDLYTGRVAINAYDSMRASLKALWKSELRMSKADLIWCFESFNTADGYFDRDQKRKSILSYIAWVVENIVPMEKEVFPEDDAPISATVKVLDNEPGGGKTRHALWKIVSGGAGKVYWWAINKISPLASERFNELQEHAEAVGVTIDFLPIHCEAKGRGTMKMRIDARMREINNHPHKDETIFVTIITHKTLIDHYLANVSGTILIDEPVQVWCQQHFEFPASFRTMRQLIVPVDVAADYDGDLNATIDTETQAVRFVLTDEGRQEANDEVLKRDTIRSSYRWIIEQADKSSGRVYALAEQWNSLDDTEQGGLDVLALLHPKHIAHFDECWMMAAYFKELLIYQLWSELYDVEWQFCEIEDRWQRIIPLRDRVTLYYVLENRQVTDTYLTNRGDPKRRRAMAQAVKEFFGDAPFIWSVGESQRETGDYACLAADVTGADGHWHPAYLTPKANGINCYQNVHGAAWLGTIKLPSTLLEIIGRLWGRADTRRMALVEYELYSCLQFLARINSRRFDSADQVRPVVADKVQAEYIVRMWNLDPARVLPLPMRQSLKDDLDDVASKGTGRKKIKTDEERREYLRQKQAKRRATKAEAAGREVGRNGRPRKTPKA